MARKVEWTDIAWNDLAKIADYIAMDSPHYAAAFVSEVSDAADSLQKFASRGRKVPEFYEASIRELLIRNYRLIYKVQRQRVSILAFIHGSRKI